MSRADGPAPRATRLALLVALLAAACGDDGVAPDPEPAPPAPLTRLWRDVPPERALRQGEHGAAAAARTLLEARFDGTQPWWQGRVEGERVVFAPAPPVSGELELTAGPSTGLTHALPVEPGSALHVTLRARPTAPRAPAAELELAALVLREEPFDPADSPDTREVSRLLDPRRGRVHVLRGELGAEPVEAEARFVVDAGVRELQVLLLAPNAFARRPFVVESLRIERVPLVEHLAAGGALPNVEPLDVGVKGAVAATLDRDRRAGLLLPPDGVARWRLPAWSAPRRLEFAWGLPPWGADSAGVRARVSVRRAGASEPDAPSAEPLLDETLVSPASVEQPAWHDRVLELPASPDAALELSFETEALDARAPVVVLGHPAVSLPRAPDDARPNVLLISLDTVRPDRLGCYGGDPRVSTHLDALAAEGLRFAEASSTSAYTLPSHGSMLTGQYPAEHGAVDVADRLDPSHSPMLAALLAEAGWHTAGFTAGGYVGARYGFAHGFDRYAENDPVWPHDTLRGDMLLATAERLGAPVPEPLLRRYGADALVEWLGARRDGPPFFAFVHTYIAHNYAPSRAWLERFELLVGPEEREEPFNHKPRDRFNKGERALLEEVREAYLPYYDATLGMADDFVGTLLQALERFGLDEDTLVIVTSDHGEEFGEHGFFGHGETLYNGNTRVPLIVRLPGPRDAREARVIHDPVSLADLPPWILRLCGLPPDPRMSGAAELWRLDQVPPRRTGLFLELDNHRYRKSAVRQARLKLHVDLEVDREPLEPPAVRLYDVVADPDETTDLAADPAYADDLLRLRERLATFHEITGAIHPRDGAVTDPCDLDPALRAQLAALGYLAGLDCDD